jgi:hypothetical protein
MLANRKFVCDSHSEIFDMVKDAVDFDFWDFAQAPIIDGAVYLFGRQQFMEHQSRIVTMIESQKHIVIFGNPAEGSSTLEGQLRSLGLEKYVLEKKLLVISGGKIDPAYPALCYDYFLDVCLGYEENTQAMANIDKIFDHRAKPYSFLFLNGRSRPHRKYLIERLREQGLLEQALWTCLDPRPPRNRDFDLESMKSITEIKRLPSNYEYPKYRQPVQIASHQRHFIKYDMFDNTWGEVYIYSAPYIDSYFSLVTETVYEVPRSFRTEKIVKPLAQGHPWICAASPGFYRDIKALGFRSFDSVIDESFDQIDNAQDRMDRILAVVNDLCHSDLSHFLDQTKHICKYNQQRLIEYRNQIRTSLPQRLVEFVEQYSK